MPRIRFNRSELTNHDVQNTAAFAVRVVPYNLLGQALLGNNADNLLVGGSTKNVFFGGGGNDKIVGSSGPLNTAVYAYSIDKYKITTTNDGITVKALVGKEGTDSLTNVNQLIFAGQTYQVQPTINGAPATVTLLSPNTSTPSDTVTTSGTTTPPPVTTTPPPLDTVTTSGTTTPPPVTNGTPTITSGATATAINENIAPGQVVYTATSTDAGNIATGSTSYSLKAGTGDVAAFTINPTTGAVTLTGSPNFEAKPSYSFTVVATDPDGNRSEKAVSLAVKNLDESAPTISSGTTAAAINENIAAGQVVYTATSTDAGDIATGSTRYSLKAGTGDATAFTINPTTGAVTLTGSPNFEAKPSYSFTVVATDAAGNQSEKAVSLAVKNLDESAPTITSGATATAINENIAPGQVVYTVTSTDAGDIATGSTSYSLKAGTGDATAFTINPTTGAVTLTGSPDFEAKPSYSFTVVATDAAGNQSQKAVSLGVNNLVETTTTTTNPPPPPPPAPVSTLPGELPSFSLQNTSGAAEATGYVTFGQVFAKGAVMPGTALVAKINGQDVAVQMDVKTTNADGSVGHAILTLKAPALATDGSVTGMLAKAGSPSTAPAIQAQDILSKGFDFKVQVTLHNADGSTTIKTIDAAQALQQAIANGTVETWMKGAQASEFRVEANIVPNLDVKFDIRMDALGQTRTDVIFARDDAYTTNVSTLNYDVKFTQGGQTVFTDTNIQQYAYSTWHQAVSSPGSIDPHVVYDMPYLMKTGAIPSYDLNTTVSPTAIADMTQALAQSNTGPMGSALVQQYMPGTGGRDDIGPETTWSATYLASQSAEALKVLLANADAAGSVPWHLIDANGDAVRVDLRPNLWVDSRGFGQGPDSLPVAYTPWTTGWDPDTAHAPSLSFVPYLLTGTRYYLDELQAQAAYDIAAMNPSYRGYGDGQFMDDNVQVRHLAWGLRDVANAAYITPDGEAMKAYFTTILNNNFDRMITDYVNGAKGDAQGELEGMIGGLYGDNLRMAPWQQDYVATVLGLIAERGDAKAAAILDWMDGFLAGRFLNEANGFDPLNGTTYNLSTINPATGQMYTTWAQMYQATFGSTHPTTLEGYPDWAGGYAANAKAALASMISVTQSADAIEAYGFLQSQTTAMLTSYQTDPTWNIAPQLANGQYLTNDEVFVHTATTGTTMTAGAGEQMLIGNIGNDTIVGGSGIGLLFGMDGNDTIRAGSGNAYLYGGDGNDRLVDGAGGNYFKGGAGADVFAFTTASTGLDTIDDFTKGIDRIEIQSNLNGSGITTAAAVVAGATADSSGQAVLHLGGSHEIVLQGVMLNQLTSDIFTIV